ncbi:hypothetical protein EJF36_03035 [Bacillus sp. HMF5848]|uniref:DUF6944 family repetitive protein n=1 Tax=Bacillus sp. HMF5848 TaxID=2495421 RepID=UPI000F78C1ED|nr:hypothetical protein [Bacillus sp. HMF5848]RSK25951.1 hypothetical protein EJF36_03035 [Bacillus sp. HMF5848]
MCNKQKATWGAWIQAVGTTLSAIGSTPSLNIDAKILQDLDLVGNVLQATGDALQADSEQGLERIGNEVQAIGNSIIVGSYILNVRKQTKLKLTIQGDLLQALGSSLVIVDELREDRSVDTLLNIEGNLLQVVGNTLQAIAAKLKLKNKDGDNLNAIGSWIQAIGAILSALSQNK